MATIKELKNINDFAHLLLCTVEGLTIDGYNKKELRESLTQSIDMFKFLSVNDIKELIKESFKEPTKLNEQAKTFIICLI